MINIHYIEFEIFKNEFNNWENTAFGISHGCSGQPSLTYLDNIYRIAIGEMHVKDFKSECFWKSGIVISLVHIFWLTLEKARSFSITYFNKTSFE